MVLLELLVEREGLVGGGAEGGWGQGQAGLRAWKEENALHSVSIPRHPEAQD